MLVSIDPGETVGVYMENENGSWTAEEKDWKSFLKVFENLLQMNSRDMLVLVEGYVIRPETVQANYGKVLRTPMVIGVIEWLCMRRGVEMKMVPPGIGNKFFNRKRLEDEGKWVVGKEHARSAIIQALYYKKFGI